MMTWLMLIALAAALAADAFAVALCQGAVARSSVRDAVRIGTASGLAQAVMPLIGWAAGVAFASVIRDADRWLAFGLLGLLGARTLRDGSATNGRAAQSCRVGRCSAPPSRPASMPRLPA